MRLTEDQRKRANMLAHLIDCSEHEWPKDQNEIQLLCHGYLDRVADNHALRARIAELEAERDAARAGEARALEALRRCHEGAARQLAEPRDHDNDQYALTAIATDCEAVSQAQGPALDWLAQQRREAAAEALEDIAKESGTDGGKAYFASVVYREFPDRLTMRIGAVEAGELIMRAAALRAGATGGADAG